MTLDTFSFPTAPRHSDRFAPIVRRRPGTPWPVSTLILWQDRARMRAQLAALPPYLWTDMGLDPAQVAYETRKPFWRP